MNYYRFINKETLCLGNTGILTIDLEYYIESLEGLERQLEVYSSYEKGEIGADFIIK